jgi:hypothetical protein
MIDLIEQLESAGYVLSIVGDSIRCQWQGAEFPDPVTAKLLLSELRANKDEALEALRLKQTGNNDVYRIYSRILYEEVWIVQDGWVGELGGTTYSHSEVLELDRLQVTSDDLRKIHAAKIALDGDVVCS